jgi:hypothetical protein
MVAAKLANVQHAGDRKSDQGANLHVDAVSRKQAAELLNVSPRSVASAATSGRACCPELLADRVATQRCIAPNARIHAGLDRLPFRQNGIRPNGMNPARAGTTRRRRCFAP